MSASRGLAPVLVAALLAVSACGGDGDSSAAPAPDAPGDADTSAAAPAATPGASAAPGQPLVPTGPADGGAPPADAAPAPEASKPGAEPTRATLRVAAQRYANALLQGDFVAVVPLLDASCTDKDRDALAGALGIVKRMAKGATMRITGVRVVEDTGAPTRYKLSRKASPQLRIIVKQAFLASGGTNPWRWVDGRWVNTGPCSGAEEQGTPV